MRIEIFATQILASKLCDCIGVKTRPYELTSFLTGSILGFYFSQQNSQVGRCAKNHIPPEKPESACFMLGSISGKFYPRVQIMHKIRQILCMICTRDFLAVFILWTIIQAGLCSLHRLATKGGIIMKKLLSAVLVSVGIALIGLGAINVQASEPVNDCAVITQPNGVNPPKDVIPPIKNG